MWHFLSEQAAGPNGLTETEQNNKEALNAYIDERTATWTPRIYVWWIKFLVCEVDVKKQYNSKSSRSSSMIKNFKANLDKKISNFAICDPQWVMLTDEFENLYIRNL